MTSADGNQAWINKAFIIDNANAGITNSTYYRVINAQTGKSLDITGIDPSPGAVLQQWSYLNGSNQVVQLYATDDGFFEFEMLHSQKALGALNGTGNGAEITQATYEDIPEQKWQLSYRGGGYYAILNQASGKVLDVALGSSRDGASIQLWSFLGTANQLWQIIPEPSIPTGSLGGTGTNGSSTNYNLDPDDVAAPGTPSLSPLVSAPPQVGCLPDARLVANPTAGKPASYDGLTHYSWIFTDTSGRLEAVPSHWVYSAFSSGFQDWNGYQGVTGARFDPLSPGLPPRGRRYHNQRRERL